MIHRVKTFFNDGIVLVAVVVSLGLITSYIMFGHETLNETPQTGNIRDHSTVDMVDGNHNETAPRLFRPRTYVIGGNNDRYIRKAVYAIGQASPHVTWKLGQRTTNNQATVHVASVQHLSHRDHSGTRSVAGLTEWSSTQDISVKIIRNLGSGRWVVALHEFAHAAGIKHESAPCSLMNPTIGLCAQAVTEHVVAQTLKTNNDDWLQCLWTHAEYRQWQRLFGPYHRFGGCSRVDRMRKRIDTNQRRQFDMLKSQLSPTTKR